MDDRATPSMYSPLKLRISRIMPVLVPFLLLAVAHAALSANGIILRKADGIVRAPGQKGALEAYLPIIRKQSHAANLLSLPNGNLLCFWFTGTREGSSGVSIAMSRLNHGSNQWTQPIVLSRHPGWSDQNPVPFPGPNGVLRLFHTSQKANQGQTTAIVYELTSVDAGYTWTRPRILFPKPGTFIRQRPILFRNKWLFRRITRRARELQRTHSTTLPL
jgi:predicted neuraminidase